jgi:hypothetical protein
MYLNNHKCATTLNIKTVNYGLDNNKVDGIPTKKSKETT